MISVYQLKAKFQNMLRPLCAELAAKGVTANQVTLAALIPSIAYGAALWWGGGLVWLLLPVFLFIRMGLSTIVDVTDSNGAVTVLREGRIASERIKSAAGPR